MQVRTSLRRGPDERGHFGIYGGRFVAETLMPLVLAVAAMAGLAGCTPATSAGQPYACPAGVPWVPDGYANAKFVPAHCQGEPAK